MRLVAVETRRVGRLAGRVGRGGAEGGDTGPGHCHSSHYCQSGSPSKILPSCHQGQVLQWLDSLAILLVSIIVNAVDVDI